MDDTKLDRETLAKLAKALAFICSADHAATLALKQAAESGTKQDAKKAHAAFLKLKPGQRAAALAMISG
jgi:hypothetical protein